MPALTNALDLLDIHTCLALLSLLLFTYIYFRRPKNLPPGPRGWPIVGNLPSMAKTDSLHLEFMEWQKKYGPVVYFRMGMLDAVMLGGYDVIHQALVKQGGVFSSRPAHLAVMKEMTNNGKGIAFAPSGPHWKEQRKFALTTLRSFGFGKRSMEVKITEESAALREEINNMDGNPFDIARLLQKATTNIICSMVFAHRFEYDSPQFLRLMEDLDDVATSPIFTMPENIFPFLAHFINSCSADKVALLLRKDDLKCGDTNSFGIIFSPHQQPIKANQHALAYIRTQVKQHEETFDPNDIRDFIDAFLLEMKNQDERDSTFTEEQLLITVFDLFLAGTETTATTLRWASLLMIVNPDIQRKVHEEIDSVLGKGQPPSMSHRAQLPYTQAVLTETARFATIVPLNVPHTTSEETTLNGYHIPKNCLVIPSIWSVHHDDKLFPQPDKFDPTRFLDDDGQFKKDDHVMPFSTGPRICLGEQLAKMELFLLFTSLIQHFTFKLPEGAPAPSLEGHVGAARSPGHFDMVASVRD